MTAAASQLRSSSARAGLLDRAAFVSLAVLALSLTLEPIRPLVEIDGLMSFSTVEALLLATVGLWILSLVAAKRWPAVPRRLALPLAIWLVLLLASALLAPAHRLDSLKFLSRVVNGILVGWAAYDLVLAQPDGRRRWTILLQGLVVAGILVAGFGLAEAAGLSAVVRWLGNFKHAPTVVGDALRVSSLLPYATIAAMILELTLPLMLAWSLITRHNWLSVLLVAGVIAGLATLALTLTRAGVLALSAALLLSAAVAWHRRLRIISGAHVATVAGLVALVLLILVLNPVARLRLRSESAQQWYQVRYDAPAELSLAAGQRTTVPVTVVNAGVRTWEASGPQPFALGYHLRADDGSQWHFEGHHTALPANVRPGDSIVVQARLYAPQQPGTYLIEWDMVHEQVTWFSWRNAAPGLTRLEVVPGALSAGSAPDAYSEPSTYPAELVVVPTVGRLQLWTTAAAMVLDRPLLGVGPDNFRHFYGSYAGVEAWDTRVHANNLYVEWLADTGILGFLAFLWLSIRLFQLAWRNLPDGSRETVGPSPALDRPSKPGGLAGLVAGRRSAAVADEPRRGGFTWQLALLTSLTAWYLHGMLDQFYEFTPTYVAFWLISALAVAGPMASGQRYGTHPAGSARLEGQETQPCA